MFFFKKYDVGEGGGCLSAREVTSSPIIVSVNFVSCSYEELIKYYRIDLHEKCNLILIYIEIFYNAHLFSQNYY